MDYLLVTVQCSCRTIPFCIDYGWPGVCRLCGDQFEIVSKEVERYHCE